MALYNPDAKVALQKDRSFAAAFDSEGGGEPPRILGLGSFRILNASSISFPQTRRSAPHSMCHALNLGRLKSSFHRFNTIWKEERDPKAYDDLRKRGMRLSEFLEGEKNDF